MKARNAIVMARTRLEGGWYRFGLVEHLGFDLFRSE
jgi:hypothetical protein